MKKLCLWLVGIVQLLFFLPLLNIATQIQSFIYFIQLVTITAYDNIYLFLCPDYTYLNLNKMKQLKITQVSLKLNEEAKPTK